MQRAQPELLTWYRDIKAGCALLARKASWRSSPSAATTAVKSNAFHSTLQLGIGGSGGWHQVPQQEASGGQGCWVKCRLQV